jgi:hypothetical protein
MLAPFVSLIDGNPVPMLVVSQLEVPLIIHDSD